MAAGLIGRRAVTGSCRSVLGRARGVPRERPANYRPITERENDRPITDCPGQRGEKGRERERERGREREGGREGERVRGLDEPGHQKGM